ncbi:MAG: MMPL family transporter [Alphaproteobacteria bacterium]|nr:MMPL family transporter [Alphaproteobacteria bacterium]
MTAARFQRGGQALDRWIGGVQRRPWSVLAVALALSVAALALTVAHLGVITDTADMISAEAQFMRDYRAYKAPFPRHSDTITIIVEADTPDRMRDSVDRLVVALRAESDMFPYIHTPGGGPFFARNGLLYLDRGELLDLFDSLSDSQPLLQRLRQDMSLRGLLAVIRLGLDDPDQPSGDGQGLDWLLGRMAEAVAAAQAGAPTQMSWQEIMYGRSATASDRRGVVIVQPKVLDYDSLLPGATALGEIRRIAAAAGLVPDNGIRVSLTGGLALGYDELATVQRGAKLAGMLSLVLVTAILFAGLRSPRLVLVSLITLVMGLIWTAGFATLAVGHLNMISVAFAVLFVSLGIDFSIHLCLHIRELTESGHGGRDAVAAAVRAVGGALALCALATAIGFYAFIPTDYSGVSELGLIAGSGMFIALIANLTVLPALLSLWPPPARTSRARRGVIETATALLEAWPERHWRSVCIGALILAVGSAVLVPQVRFDFNPINLQDPDADSVRVVRRLMAEGDRGLWAAGVRVPDAETAARLAAGFEALDTVDFTLGLADFVPEDQEQRLDLIADIAFALEPDAFAPQSYLPPDGAEQIAALAAFTRVLAGHTTEGAEALHAALEAVLATGPDPALIEAVERSLLGALPARLGALEEALRAVPFGIEDLPDELVERYRGTDGSLRLQVYPAQDIVADNDALRRFVADLKTVSAEVTDDPVVVLEAGRTVIGAFAQALVSAVAIIAVLLLALTRRLGDTALILAPLALAALLTGATTVVLHAPFNFANVIVLPLLVGIGVHSAIHLMHRHRSDPDSVLLATSTARAVFYSALTTIAGFGSLAISPHLGTASLGQLLMIGVVYTLLCTLILLPALLAPGRLGGWRP